MSSPETFHIIDPAPEQAPRSMEDVINDHIAIHLGWYAMGTPVFRRFSSAELENHAVTQPERHAKIREEVERNLAERASWGQLPAGFEPLRAIKDTDAA